MATDVENLKTRRTAVIAELAAITSVAAGGKPNSSTGVDHVGYKDGLYRELAFLNEQIEKLGGSAEGGGAWEVASRGLT